MTDIGKATLDAIVKDGKILGFKSEGFDNGRFDGYGYHSTNMQCLILPAGRDAPDVFELKQSYSWAGSLAGCPYEPPKLRNTQANIISGARKAVQKAYLLVLEHATGELGRRNDWIKSMEDWQRLGTRGFKAVLVDNAKDRIKNLI